MRFSLNYETPHLTPAMAFTLPIHPPAPNTADLRLSDVGVDEVVELVRFDMPDDQVEPFLERGVLPGCRLCPVRHSPSGDPIVEVDGVLLAFRREMAGCLCVKRADADIG